MGSESQAASSIGRITREIGIRCKRPKLEPFHGRDFEEGEARLENYKQKESALSTETLALP